MSLIDDLNSDRELMLKAVREAKTRGFALAQAESEYQVAKNTRALELRADDMPATMISLVLKGDPQVSEKLFARDCAKVEYESAQEAINAYKLSARLIENQIQREWNAAGGI